MFLLMYTSPLMVAPYTEKQRSVVTKHRRMSLGVRNTETVGESIIHLIKIAHTKDIKY